MKSMGPERRYETGHRSGRAVQKFANSLGPEYQQHAAKADQEVFGGNLGGDDEEGPFQAALARLGTVQGFVVGLYGERSRAWSEFVWYCANKRAHQDQTKLGLSARFSHLVHRHRGFMIARLGRLAARALVRCKQAVAAWADPIDRRSSSTRALREMMRHRQELAAGDWDAQRPSRASLSLSLHSHSRGTGGDMDSDYFE